MVAPVGVTIWGLIGPYIIIFKMTNSDKVVTLSHFGVLMPLWHGKVNLTNIFSTALHGCCVNVDEGFRNYLVLLVMYGVYFQYSCEG